MNLQARQSIQISGRKDAEARGPEWDVHRNFLVARNPDPESSLPIVLRLPIGSEGLVLKTRDTWPRTSKLYCHRADGWPDVVEVLDDVAVRSCVRRGPAIDLVLDRSRESRSQFVFTRIAGQREAIFWQTPRTVRGARPGARVPRRSAAGLAGLEIVVDTRERYAYKFTDRRVTLRRAALPAGDYAIELEGALVASVERKRLEDLSKSLVDGNLAFALAELAGLDRGAVVVEGRYSDLFKLEHVRSGFVPDLVARVQARYPQVPIVWCETRKLAEEWTYRWLSACWVELRGDPTLHP